MGYHFSWGQLLDWGWWEHKVVWENSSSALRLSFPPAYILCGLGEKDAVGKVIQIPKLLPPQVPPLLNLPFSVPSPARCLSYLPQYFHLVPPSQCQLIWGLRVVVKQDPVGLGAGD